MKDLKEAVRRSGLEQQVVWEDTMLENTRSLGRDGQ